MTRGLKLAPRFKLNDAQSKPSDCIIRYGDDFTIISKHGFHRCLLSEPLCGDILTVRKLFPQEKLPMVVCKQIAKDVLLGLKYLHRELGVVHTGKHYLTLNCAFPVSC
jgi:serine/threonine-protein kinase SRPK3